MPKYRTILVDPPWPSKAIGKFKAHGLISKDISESGTPYGIMSMPDILALPIQRFAAVSTHLWLWTTNRFIHEAFHCLESWGFKYLYTFTAYKPSGCGAYMAVTTQHLLLGYYKRCIFNKKKWFKLHFPYTPSKHSQKPEIIYEIIEAVSEEPRLELFARQKREGWDVWGNEVECNIEL